MSETIDPTTTPDAGMAANRGNWNARVPGHVGPDGYDIAHLTSSPDTVSHIVEFDRERLGDLTGLDVVHLQCHIGTDTVSLARLGAQVSGLDFAGDALAEARDLADACDVNVRFVEGNVYDAPAVLGAQYDLVYTGVGAINWLPHIRPWAQVVAALLRPGGRLHMFEGHPVLWSLASDATPENLRLGWPYFEVDAPVRSERHESYLGSGEVTEPVCFEWNHGLGEVIGALLAAGLELTGVEEHRVVPWRAFPWFEPVPGTLDWTQLPEPQRDLVPLSYTLQARKPD